MQSFAGGSSVIGGSYALPICRLPVQWENRGILFWKDFICTQTSSYRKSRFKLRFLARFADQKWRLAYFFAMRNALYGKFVFAM